MTGGIQIKKKRITEEVIKYGGSRSARERNIQAPNLLKF